MKFSKNIFVLALLAAFAAVFVSACCGGAVVFAASPVGGEDGVYSANVDLSGLAMGADRFSSVATVEKFGENYYFTFGHSSAVSDLQLISENGLNVGSTSYSEGGWIYHTYTLSAERLQQTLDFSAYITAMKMTINFSVKLDLANAVRTGDYTNTDERPAEYVPQIVCESGVEYSAEKGSAFTVPQVSATFGDKTCTITNELFFGGEKISENVSRFNLSDVGEYTVVFKATDIDSKYKTNFGNDSYSTLTITVRSKVGATTLAKFEDSNGALPEGAVLQASELTQGSVFDTAKAAMANIADNFCVVDVQFFDQSGNNVTPTDSVTLKIQPLSTFDRRKTQVYYMSEEGTLTQIDCSPYGRYVELQSDKTGTFIVCVPGVEFVMPMWGYALIIAAVVIIIVAAVISLVVLKKRK